MSIGQTFLGQPPEDRRGVALRAEEITTHVVVNSTHLMPELAEVPHGLGSDQSGRAGHEYLHRAPSSLAHESRRDTTNGPRTRTPMGVRAKQSIASAGVQTIGSFSLKDVLRRTGTPVSLSNSEISRQYSGWVRRLTVCSLPLPSTCVGAGIDAWRSGRTRYVMVMNGEGSLRSKYRQAASSSMEGAKGRKSSRRLILALSTSRMSARRG